MFYNNQTQEQKQQYRTCLQTVGGLSNLFSESQIRYLYYRAAEKVFCQSFGAEDLSRSDVSADAKANNIGIGLKTFLAGNNKSFQKVAEFNSLRPTYINLPAMQMVQTIAKYRNDRISITESAFELTSSIYHCVVRDKGVFKIFEQPMHKVNIDGLKILKENKNSIIFTDGLNEYSFSLSKCTLSKKFVIDQVLEEFSVEILNDPLNDLIHLKHQALVDQKNTARILDTIILPLYSAQSMKVQEQSGLNLWNASGRKRDYNEVYIPIAKIIHTNHPDFFPQKDVCFKLKLPSGRFLKTKLCQSGRKALMSDPNKALGQWLLRGVLGLEEGELLAYNKLLEIGVDSVRIDKIDDANYEINFSKTGSYEKFMSNAN